MRRKIFSISNPFKWAHSNARFCRKSELFWISKYSPTVSVYPVGLNDSSSSIPCVSLINRLSWINCSLEAFSTGWFAGAIWKRSSVDLVSFPCCSSVPSTSVAKGKRQRPHWFQVLAQVSWQVLWQKAEQHSIRITFVGQVNPRSLQKKHSNSASTISGSMFANRLLLLRAITHNAWSFAYTSVYKSSAAERWKLRRRKINNNSTIKQSLPTILMKVARWSFIQEPLKRRSNKGGCFFFLFFLLRFFPLFVPTDQKGFFNTCRVANQGCDVF